MVMSQVGAFEPPPSKCDRLLARAKKGHLQERLSCTGEMGRRCAVR